MWKYYGAKTNVVHLYPKPKYDKIIEPFAGTARYALRYFEKEVLLVDKYDVIIKIWKWLQQCSPNDIKKLPRLKMGQKISDFNFDCEEAMLLTSFTMGFVSSTPRKTATLKMEQRPNFANYVYNNIASQLFKIKHWQFICGSYEDVPNEKATWYIDPPYQKAGSYYKYHKIDYNKLRTYCLERDGQVIVCESAGASWMNFVSLAKHYGSRGFNKELIWTNEKTDCGHVQLGIFSDELILS